MEHIRSGALKGLKVDVQAIGESRLMRVEPPPFTFPSLRAWAILLLVAAIVVHDVSGRAQGTPGRREA